MSRLIDVVAPRRLGRDFRWLLPSSWVSDLGDGIVLAAGPLLVASQTRDPLLIAAATVLQRLPWMLFGLYAGVLADRLDRRALVVWVDVARAVVLGVLAATIATGRLSVWIVLVSMFVLGTAETFVDTTTSTLLPMVVDASDLGVANARLMVGRITINRLAGPPLGALLFAAGMTVPFVAQAVLVALGAVLISRIGASRPIRPTEVVSVRTDVIEGLRWVWAHPPIRTLTITILSFNVTFGAAWSILVLYALERLGLSDLGFGLLTACGAAGGIITSAGYGWLERRVGAANIMRIGLVIETLFHLCLAVTTTPLVAFGVFFVFGMHEAAWGTTATTIRQRAVPNEFQGRVGSIYMVGVHGSLVVGAVVGGVVSAVWGTTAPFWFGFAGSAAILAVMWRRFAVLVDA